MTTLYSTETVGDLTTVQSRATVATRIQADGFPGVAELTELPRFNINHQAEFVTPSSPIRSHRLKVEQQEEEKEEEEEEEDIVSSEAFRKCSIMILKSIILNPYHERS